MWGKTSVLILAMLLVGSILIQPALGEEYPTKPIEIVVQWTPGTPTDIMTRLVAEIAPKYLKQPIVVVNKPGASGSLAAGEVISSKPDGYKLLSASNLYFATTAKTQKIPFDPNDLAPIVNFMEMKNGVCVRGDSPWKTFADLLDYGRKNPGKLRMVHTGRGIGPHITLLLIFRKAGVEATDLFYPGGPEKVSALLGGHVDAASMTYGSAKDLAKAGRIRFLIFMSEQRYSDPSDVPTAVELGFPEAAKIATIFGLYVHKNTSEKIKKILFDGFKKTYEDPEFKKGIEKLGEEPKFGGAEFINESIKKTEEVGVPILKELGLYVGK